MKTKLTLTFFSLIAVTAFGMGGGAPSEPTPAPAPTATPVPTAAPEIQRATLVDATTGEELQQIVDRDWITIDDATRARSLNIRIDIDKAPSSAYIETRWDLRDATYSKNVGQYYWVFPTAADASSAFTEGAHVLEARVTTHEDGNGGLLADRRWVFRVRHYAGPIPPTPTPWPSPSPMPTPCPFGCQ